MSVARAGRPRTTVTATNAANVEEMVTANRRSTVQEISEGLNISHGSVLTIIHDHLNMPRDLTLCPVKARGRFIIHQDNAPPHGVLVVRAALRAEGIEVLKHSPYSPGLAPSDHWLFAALKNDLRGRRGGSARFLRSGPPYTSMAKGPLLSFRVAIQDLVKRWGRCVRLQDEFVESEPSLVEK